MADPRKCVQCGAVAKRLDARFCEFCGYEFDKSSPPPPAVSQAAPPPARAAPPHVDLGARFEALARHPDLPGLLEREPNLTGRLARGAFAIVPILVFTGGALFLLVVFAQLSRSSGFPLWIVPLGFVAVGAFMLVAVLRRVARLGSAPLQRELAHVVDKRTEISGQGDSTTTRYFATLERGDGRRAEFETDGRVAGLLAGGDMGVAYTKAEVLLDFQRLRA